MKIKTKEFLEYVRKSSLNGKILTMSIEFTEKGLLSILLDDSGTTMTVTTLNKDVIENYDSSYSLYIRNTANFLKHLEKLDEYFEMEIVEDHILKISSGNRESYIMLCSEEACENLHKGKLPETKVETDFVLDKKSLMPILKDMNDVSKIVYIKKTAEEVVFQVGEKEQSDYFKTKFVTDSTGEATVSFGEMFYNSIQLFDKTIMFALTTNSPGTFSEVGDFITFTVIIAPIVKDN